MSWKFLKRDPSNEMGAYFVEIQNDEIDFDNTLIAEIVKDLGGLETWPRLTLQEFKDFTEQLRVKMALGSGEIVEIGDVTYLMVNPDTHKVQDTGLSWDGAAVPPNMQNFVISTIEQVLNDPDIRVDEQIGYTMLQNAMVQLISAAETLTDLDAGDMPVLPDEEAYTTALEGNQTLHVTPRKLTDGPQVTMAPEQSDVSEVSEESDVSIPTPESLEAPEPPAPAAPMVSVPTVPGTSTIPQAPKTDTESQPSAPAAPKTRVSREPKRADTLTDKIQQFKVTAPSFAVDEHLLTGVINPEDDGYVDVMVARQKAAANQMMARTADDLTAATHQELLAAASKATLNTEAIDKLLSDDWQAPLSNKIAHKQQQAFANRLAETKKNLTAVYDENVSREKQRHENTLSELQRQFDADMDKMTVQNESDRDRSIQAETAQAIAQQSLYIDKEVATLRQQAEDVATHKIIDDMVKRQTQVERVLADTFDNMSADIEQDRQQFLVEHERALEKRQTADEASAKKKQAEIANHDLQQLESSKHSLEAERVKLQEKVVKLQAESAKWQAQAEGTQSDLERLTARVTELTQGEQQTALIAALAGSRQPEQAPTAPVAPASKSGFLKGALVSAVVMLGIGGIGYGTLHALNTQAKAEASVKAAESSYNAKAVSLQKQVKKDSQSSAKADTASSATSASSAATSSETPANKQDFGALDADVTKGSLKTYYQTFNNRDLETEERTLAVGKLLISAKQLDDAKQLADANDGHSNQLLALISKQ
ncbi:hypothetical protein B9D04_04215 [Weissella cibaria]|uniref:Uncharacterized protein n=1 Tax=Weissella cibaria TaxID=137591 RepID=A0A1X4JLS2_9LACO|nr:hypothetical protein [Weissella cibaria]OSP89730.1 hypothetical protein B9D04_04215 [Weissella cibaria]